MTHQNLWDGVKGVLNFPDGSGVKNLLPMQTCKRHRFDRWVTKIPWSRKWQPNPVFLPEKFHGQRSMVGYSPWGYVCVYIYM